MASVSVNALCEQGIAAFCRGEAATAARLLKRGYSLDPQAEGLLVNLGLGLMQQGHDQAAARAYELALGSSDGAVRRAAHKNLGLLRLWQGRYSEGWALYRQRHQGLPHATSEWHGEPLNGQTLTVWNDLGMGDAFQFVRYTLPLLQRGERIRLAVHAGQIALFEQRLAWPLAEVVDRAPLELSTGPHIPLIHLAALLDPQLQWGRRFAGPTFQGHGPTPAGPVGLCWASNPADATMAPYKSLAPERLLALAGASPVLSLQTDEPDAHQRLGLQPAQRDWLHTLEQIGRCSRVLSVDTAVAHLAAGSGVPVQLLLGAVPDWRWRHNGTQAWYPCLTTVAPGP